MLHSFIVPLERVAFRSSKRLLSHNFDGVSFSDTFSDVRLVYRLRQENVLAKLGLKTPGLHCIICHFQPSHVMRILVLLPFPVTSKEHGAVLTLEQSQPEKPKTSSLGI